MSHPYPLHYVHAVDHGKPDEFEVGLLAHAVAEVHGPDWRERNAASTIYVARDPVSGQVELAPAHDEGTQGWAEERALWSAYKTSIAAGVRAVVQGSLAETADLQFEEIARSTLPLFERTGILRVRGDNLRDGSDVKLRLPDGITYSESESRKDLRTMLDAMAGLPKPPGTPERANASDDMRVAAMKELVDANLTRIAGVALLPDPLATRSSEAALFEAAAKTAHATAVAAGQVVEAYRRADLAQHATAQKASELAAKYTGIETAAWKAVADIHSVEIPSEIAFQRVPEIAKRHAVTPLEAFEAMCLEGPLSAEATRVFERAGTPAQQWAALALACRERHGSHDFAVRIAKASANDAKTIRTDKEIVARDLVGLDGLSRKHNSADDAQAKSPGHHRAA